MTGNLADATLALAGSLPLFSDEGATRIVYRVGDVVYKVNRGIWNFNPNRAEYRKSQSLKNLPEGVYIPETSLYNIGGSDVIAMEYVEGTAVAECYCNMAGDRCDETCMSNEVWDKVNGYLDDTSGSNTIIKDNGDIYLIDLA